MSTQPAPENSQELIAAYKAILRDILDRRPSGMRQRLAEALGKNRSFITQIANPAYQTPIPAQHVHAIIQVCHFSVQEKERFLAAPVAPGRPQARQVIGNDEHRRIADEMARYL